MDMKRSLTIFLLMLWIWPVTGPAAANEGPWKLLGDGRHFAMIRHALAPGGGDPDGFRLDDCSTQRNLNDVGRAQAARIGDLFRAKGIETAALYSSQWCRCMQTAEGMKLGPVQELPALNSFFQRPQDREPNMRALRAFLGAAPLTKPTVLVTHYVTISTLTDTYPSSGEIVFVRRDETGFTVVATEPTD